VIFRIFFRYKLLVSVFGHPLVFIALAVAFVVKYQTVSCYILILDFAVLKLDDFDFHTTRPTSNFQVMLKL